MKKEIPKFNSEDEEIDFWSSHSVLDYMDDAKSVHANFPNLKPTIVGREFTDKEGTIYKVIAEADDSFDIIILQKNGEKIGPISMSKDIITEMARNFGK